MLVGDSLSEEPPHELPQNEAWYTSREVSKCGAPVRRKERDGNGNRLHRQTNLEWKLLRNRLDDQSIYEYSIDQLSLHVSGHCTVSGPPRPCQQSLHVSGPSTSAKPQPPPPTPTQSPARYNHHVITSSSETQGFNGEGAGRKMLPVSFPSRLPR